MQYLIGFVIALFIALTGVGAGTVTVPVLVLFLGVPAVEAVGIGLMFSTAVKLILVPAQIARGNVVWRTLGFMLLGGVPGVIIGSLFLKHLVNAGSQNLLNSLLGAVLVTTAGWQLIYSFRPKKQNEGQRDHSPCLHGSCFLLAPRWASRRQERAHWAAPRCLASRLCCPRKWSARILPSGSSSLSSAAARIGSRTLPTPACCCN